TLDAQVMAPDLLDELGVVPALDEDPRAARHPGPRAVDGDRAAGGAGARLLRRREGGALGPLRRGEGHRRPVDEEAGAQGEGADLPPSVLEVDDVHAARLLDGDDGAHPTGVDLLDDRAGDRLERA